MPCEQPIEQRGAGAADVKKAGRRGGEADDYGHSQRMEKDPGDINDQRSKPPHQRHKTPLNLDAVGPEDAGLVRLVGRFESDRMRRGGATASK